MRAVLQIMMIFMNRMQTLKVIRLCCNAGDILCIEGRQTPNEEDKIKENISDGISRMAKTIHICQKMSKEKQFSASVAPARLLAS